MMVPVSMVVLQNARNCAPTRSMRADHDPVACLARSAATNPAVIEPPDTEATCTTCSSTPNSASLRNDPRWNKDARYPPPDIANPTPGNGPRSETTAFIPHPPGV